MMEDEKVKLASGSDDDEEANQDLSLKIVEKHLLTRAAMLNDDDDDDGDNAQSQSPSQSSPIVAAQDNVVLRKLLRGPRYFDPPDSNSNWPTCFNCGEEGHMSVNCTSAFKRQKPCFVCGSFDHGAKHCSKAQDCFICKTNGHRAKDCPQRHKSGSQNAKICLKCGDSGHDMFSCANGYSLDDLKEVQCYICKSFGHLCCVDFGGTGPTEVSCFKCGQTGHTGLACNRLRGESNTETASPSSCYKCGETGHFARECIRSAKVRKRNFEQSTPALKRHRENKDHLGIKSAPHDLGKAHKRKKAQYDEKMTATPRKSKQGGRQYDKKMNTTPRKSKQRGGWITEDPGDLSQEKGKSKHWRSSATPSEHLISGMESSLFLSTPPGSSFFKQLADAQNGNSKEPSLTKKQLEAQAQLISKNLNFNLPVKLDLTNFVYWKAQIMPAIRAFDLESYILGPVKCPNKYVEVEDDQIGESIQIFSDEYLNWKKVDQLLVCWLLSTLSETVLGQVTNCVTAYEVWNTLVQLFSQQSMAMIVHLRSQLQSFKKGALSINEYVIKMKGIADGLRAVGHVITEQELVSYILGGVGTEFDPVVVTIMAKREEITLQETQFLLMSYESRMEQMSSIAALEFLNALANILARIQKRDSPPNVLRNGQFQQFRGRFRGRARGRGGRYNGNTRLLCQVCHKPGHNASICYHRFDQTFNNGSNRQHGVSFQGNFIQNVEYQPESTYHPKSGNVNAMIASSSSVVDLAWYVDNRATNHITPYLGNLSINNEYKGNEHLAVGQSIKENFAPRFNEEWAVQAYSPEG